MDVVQLIVISTVALIASLLTLFSGFGLGLILMPAFALFFPVEVAISFTAIVHFLNNLFKLVLVGNYIDREVALKFSVTAIPASFLGAWFLATLASLEPIYAYRVSSFVATIAPIKLLVGALLLAFVWLESRESLGGFKARREQLWLGGALSGFFGGLSGHQGALRSVFLIKCDLTKEAYIATGIAIACAIDIARLFVYREKFIDALLEENLTVISVACASAFVGAFIGSLLMKKITLRFVQRTVTAMLVVISLLLIAGII